MCARAWLLLRVAWLCLPAAARLVWLPCVVAVSDPVMVARFVCLFLRGYWLPSGRSPATAGVASGVVCA